MNQSFFIGAGRTPQSWQLSLKYKAVYLGHMPEGSLPKNVQKKKD